VNLLLKRKVFSDVEIEELHQVLGLMSNAASASLEVGDDDVDPVSPADDTVFQSQNVVKEGNSNISSDVTIVLSDEVEIPPEDRSMFLKLLQHFTTVSQIECNERVMLPPLRFTNRNQLMKLQLSTE